MPIYEFYCDRCNVLFNFFSSTVETSRRPDCPRCAAPRLERRPARFAIGKPGGDTGENEGDEIFAGMDEERLERAMESMAGEMESGGADEDDPATMARFLRRFGEAAGMNPGPRMEEMIRRLESGEDPESLEKEIDVAGDGDLDEWFQLSRGGRALRERMRRPKVDDTLYFL